MGCELFASLGVHRPVWRHSLIFCKTAETIRTKFDRCGPWEEEIQICTNEVVPPWEGAIRGP